MFLPPRDPVRYDECTWDRIHCETRALSRNCPFGMEGLELLGRCYGIRIGWAEMCWPVFQECREGWEGVGWVDDDECVRARRRCEMEALMRSCPGEIYDEPTDLDSLERCYDARLKWAGRCRPAFGKCRRG